MIIEHEVVNGERAVRVSFGHWSWVCLFLVFWLCGWSFGCYGIVTRLASSPFQIKELLFALPFFLGEIVVFCIIIMAIFGRTTLTFTQSGWTKFTGIGGLGVTKRRTFPKDCEIVTDRIVTHGKHGPTTTHRLLVKTPFGTDEKQVVYSSTDAARVESLCKIAREVAGGAAAPRTDAAAGGTAAEAELERRERDLLAGSPPKGVSVSRDFEGRVFITYRRVGWAMALVNVVTLLVFAAVLFSIRHKIPLPILGAFGIAFVFPIVQIVYALFGRRAITLDHGEGTTFIGIGPLGLRRRFQYGRSFDIRLVESNTYVNNERMEEIVISRQDEKPTRICATWPNAVKPYLTSLLRHPDSIQTTFLPDL